MRSKPYTPKLPKTREMSICRKCEVKLDGRWWIIFKYLLLCKTCYTQISDRRGKKKNIG